MSVRETSFTVAPMIAVKNIIAEEDPIAFLSGNSTNPIEKRYSDESATNAKQPRGCSREPTSYACSWAMLYYYFHSVAFPALADAFEEQIIDPKTPKLKINQNLLQGMPLLVDCLTTQQLKCKLWTREGLASLLALIYSSALRCRIAAVRATAGFTVIAVACER